MVQRIKARFTRFDVEDLMSSRRDVNCQNVTITPVGQVTPKQPQGCLEESFCKRKQFLMREDHPPRQHSLASEGRVVQSRSVNPLN